jgi:predicted transcriptional regulator
MEVIIVDYYDRRDRAKKIINQMMNTDDNIPICRIIFAVTEATAIGKKVVMEILENYRDLGIIEIRNDSVFVTTAKETKKR